MTRDELLVKVRNLLSKTVANGCTEAEAATALAMARRMIDDHGLAMADLDSNGDPQFETTTVHVGKTKPTRAQFVLPVLSKVFNVRTVTKRTCLNSDPSKTVGVQFVLFGEPANVASAVWGYSFLMATFQRLWLESRHKYKQHESSTFYAGLAGGMLDRLGVLKKEDAQAAPERSTALARIESKVDQGFDQAFPTRQLVTPKFSVKGSAFSDGFQQGLNINMARPIDHTQHAQLTE